MNKNALLIIGAVLIILVFISLNRSKDEVAIKEVITQENIVKEEVIPEKKFEGIEDIEKRQIKSFDDMSIKELEKNKGAKKQQEDFDLTPSIEELIELKKKRIKAY